MHRRRFVVQASNGVGMEIIGNESIWGGGGGLWGGGEEKGGSEGPQVTKWRSRNFFVPLMVKGKILSPKPLNIF